MDQRAKTVEAERASRAAQRAEIEAEEERQARAERNRQARAEKNRKAAEALEAKKQRQAAQAAAAAEAEKQRKAEAAAAAKAEKKRKAAEKKRKARAERAARSAAPRKAKSSSSAKSSGGLNWDALARCESGGRAGVVSSNGLYHGLYQFSVPTWRSVGGKGLPSNASPAEQLKRAKLLYKRSGSSPWPVCGKRL